MTEAALITFFTPLKYSGIKVLSFVMSPMTLYKHKCKLAAEEVKEKETITLRSTLYAITQSKNTNTRKVCTDEHHFLPPNLETLTNLIHKNWRRTSNDQKSIVYLFLCKHITSKLTSIFHRCWIHCILGSITPHSQQNDN